MCSVVGYIGLLPNFPTVISALRRLEYRGYDSAGYAWTADSYHFVRRVRSVGSVAQLEQLILDQHVSSEFAAVVAGIGHTRWATHGEPTERNAHPHFDCTGSIAVVHNGVISNAYQIRKKLTDDHSCGAHNIESDTDTELLAHLLEEELDGENLTDRPAVLAGLQRFIGHLEGAFTALFLFGEHPSLMIGIRQGSPLCVGYAPDGIYCASDSYAFPPSVHSVTFVPDQTILYVHGTLVSFYGFDGSEQKPIIQPMVDQQEKHSELSSLYETVMEKEIFEQSTAIIDTIMYAESFQKAPFLRFIEQHSIERIKIIACGSSYHAGLLGKYFFEQIPLIETAVFYASEFRHIPSALLQKDLHTLYLFISQSGETADVLESLRFVQKQGNTNALIMAMTNVAESTLAREASFVLCTRAGREVAVASTKAVAAQIALLYWSANYLKLSRQDQIAVHDMSAPPFVEDLYCTGKGLLKSLNTYAPQILNFYAHMFSAQSRFIFVGRELSYPLAREFALKCNELTYLFSLGYPAGELKHGPFALLDVSTTVVIFSHPDQEIYQKILLSAQEIRARVGSIIICAYEGQEELSALGSLVFVFPKPAHSLLGPLLMLGVMQYFICRIAVVLGRTVDRPRNLAKSVTVE